MRTAVRRHARSVTWRLRAVLAALVALGLVALGGALARGGDPDGDPPRGPRPVAELNWDVPEPTWAPRTPEAGPTRAPDPTPARRSTPASPPGPTPPVRSPAPAPRPEREPGLRAGERIGLEPVTHAGFRVRHRHFAGRIDRIGAGSPALDRADATFTVRAGLAGSGCVSFEAVNYPGYYLRHRDFVIHLHRRDGSRLFDADATFCPGAGLAGRGVSLRAYNYPERYLLHDRSLLYLAGVGGEPARAAATFAVISGLP